MTNQPTPEERRTAFQTELENLMAKWGIGITTFIEIAKNTDPTVVVFIQSLTHTGQIASRFMFEANPNWQPPKPPDPPNNGDGSEEHQSSAQADIGNSTEGKKE